MQNNQNYVGGQIKVDLKQTAQGGGRGGGTAVDAKYIHLKTDPAVRNVFVRKVYGILTVQLLFTGAFMVPFVIVDEVKLYVQQNSGVYYGGLFLALIGLIAMSCFESVSRTYPANYFFCFLATLGYSILLGVSASFLDIDEIFIAAGITAAITVACALFACETKYDFTTKLPYLTMTGFLALVIAGIFALFIFPTRAGLMMLSGLGSFLFTYFSWVLLCILGISAAE